MNTMIVSEHYALHHSYNAYVTFVTPPRIDLGESNRFLYAREQDYFTKLRNTVNIQNWEDGSVSVINGLSGYACSWNHVIFVCDRRQTAISKLIVIALEVAKKQKFTKVLLPLPRTDLDHRMMMKEMYSGVIAMAKKNRVGMFSILGQSSVDMQIDFMLSATDARYMNSII